jgi:DNA-binding transcriptional MocR family regulator
MLDFSMPDPALLPFDDLITSNERVLRRAGALALQYGDAQGYAGLREWLAHDVNRRESLTLTAENFVITCGSSGALENLCEALIDPGDVVFTERPTFPGATRIIASCLADIISLPMDDEGFDPADLDRAIAHARQEGRRPKLLYTMANYHNPVATTLSLMRRRRAIEVCQANGVLIAQDDAYGALGYGPGPGALVFRSDGRRRRCAPRHLEQDPGYWAARRLDHGRTAGH